MNIYLSILAIYIAVYDIRHQIIPDISCILFASSCIRLGYHGGWILPLAIWLLCAAIASALNTPLPYGMGDAKYLAAIGLSFGTEGMLFSYLAATISSGIVCSILLLLKKIKKKDRIAFGPFISFGFLLYLLTI